MIITAIQDEQQHVQIEDRPKLNGVQFLLQVFILNDRVMSGIVVVFSNG